MHKVSAFRFQDVGFRVQGSEFGAEFRFHGLWINGLWIRVEGLGFGV